jgi:hypothetical protein
MPVSLAYPSEVFMDTLTITLAGIEYTVPKLTLRQARALGFGVLKETPTNPADFLAASIDQSTMVVSIALEKTAAHMTVEKILDSQIDIYEIRAAADKIIDFAGYARKTVDKAPGEAVPEAA